MVYVISDYSREKARALGVEIRPSRNGRKKIDVFRDGHRVASIGAMGYADYPRYMREDPKKAEIRRRAYKARHQANRTVIGSPGYYADQLLW